MSAKLMIVAGESQGQEFWIEEEVVRIGSGPGCGVRLAAPDVPEHAATLEYRDGRYSVHNRSDRALLLAGRVLEEREFGPWEEGADLQLGARTVLRLHIDGDPAPCQQAASLYTDGADEEEAGEDRVAPEVAGKSKSLTYVAIIGVCLLAFVGMLLFDQVTPRTNKSGAQEEERNEFKDFHFLVQDLANIESSDSRAEEKDGLAPEDAGRLRKLLQTGRVAELRGDRNDSRKWYGQVRDQLLRKRNQPGVRLSPVEERLWGFVIAQLDRRAKAAEVF